MTSIHPTAAILTLGCKVNQYESEALAEALAGVGFIMRSPKEVCDLYVVNSCTVTAESDRKSRQAVRKLLSQNPNAYMIVTGCSAETDAYRMAAIRGVDAVIGNRQKMAVVTHAAALLAQGHKNPTPTVDVPTLKDADFEPMTITKFDRTRAYVKIQDGCESKCAYCTIPAARGPLRSKPLEEVLREVTYLTDNGCREVVLTGIETGAWGKDLGKEYTLASLLTAVDAIPGIGRVRLGSLDPTVITAEFAETVSRLASVAPHFHLSMQSGCSATLARMRRKYNVSQAERAMARLRDVMPHVKFTTDIILGFPGETEEEFAETLAFIRRSGFLHVHAFPYSKRTGTPAAVMDGQIDEAVKRDRVHAVTQAATQGAQTILQDAVHRGTPLSVLLETCRKADGGYIFKGHTPDFLEVETFSREDIRGEICSVLPCAVSNGVITGRLMTEPIPPSGLSAQITSHTRKEDL